MEEEYPASLVYFSISTYLKTEDGAFSLLFPETGSLWVHDEKKAESVKKELTDEIKEKQGLVPDVDFLVAVDKHQVPLQRVERRLN